MSGNFYVKTEKLERGRGAACAQNCIHFFFIYPVPLVYIAEVGHNNK